MLNNEKCYSCNKIINSGEDLYRCCDATVCSPYCGLIRLTSIEKIDPYLVSPSSWNNLNKNNFYKSNKPVTFNKSNKIYSNTGLTIDKHLYSSKDYYHNDSDGDGDDDTDDNNSNIYYIASATYKIINCFSKLTSLLSNN